MHTLTIDNKSFKIDDKIANLILLISKERDELKDFAIWMTGCGYNFCQHKYFFSKRNKLLKKHSNNKFKCINSNN